MAYDQNSTSSLTFIHENVMDFNNSKPGQWFIGVLDTNNKQVFIVPVNVFEGSNGVLNQQTLSNAGPRVMNRYASGTPEDREGKQKDFHAFKTGNWLENRGNLTHHISVATHYGSEPDDCLGFTLIKVAVGGFAQMKCGSNSLNTRPDGEVKHNFSQATHSGGNITSGSVQMPENWRNSLETFLKGSPYNIINLVTSND